MTLHSTLRLVALSCALAPTLMASAHAQTIPASDSTLAPLRPPAVPLVTHDPYFSIWSETNKLYSSATRHWTGQAQQLSAMVRVDGETFRLMGSQPEESASLLQTGVVVLPTRTLYTFANDNMQVQMMFVTPALPDDLDVLSRPVTYVTFFVRSLDGKTHNVQFYTDAGADLTVNDAATQKVTWERASQGDLTALKMGSVDQPTLARRGDNVRIDWGYLYLAATNVKGLQSVLTSRDKRRSCLGQDRQPAESRTTRTRRARPSDHSPGGGAGLQCRQSRRGSPLSRTVMLAYDDEYSVNWMGRKPAPLLAAQRDGRNGAASDGGPRIPARFTRARAAFDTVN